MAEMNVIEKVKGAANIVKNNQMGGKNTPVGNLNKQIEEKMEEKSKIYGYIGMEACDLRAAGKLQPPPELLGYFEKLEEIDKEIQELNAEKQAYELQTTNKTTCVCGYILTPENKFCPQCGAPVDNGMVTCACGKQVSKSTQFCGFCGNNIQQMLASNVGQSAGGPVMMQPNVPPKPTRQCICGAQVPDGQFMCMECGRKITE